MHLNLKHPFLTQQVITYLGTKRKHLASIDRALTKILSTDPRMYRKHAAGSAIAADIFSGSGIVSRFLRIRGFTVFANDIEPYSVPINTAWLCSTASKINDYFAEPARWLSDHCGRHIDTPGYIETLSLFNNPPPARRSYFATHYAPRVTATPCFDSERLFYTQENAQRLDSWMELLHAPFWHAHPVAHAILAAGVLHQMTTNINTSGTMKGYHRGWGGPNKDALSRILAPMHLLPLPLINGPLGEVVCMDASDALTKAPDVVDLLFLDPPAHAQQYSSNYHLLNSFCNNGTFNPGPVAHGTRAGIPPEHYRSPYSKTRDVSYAFEDLVEQWSDRARHMIVTYDRHGILPYKQVTAILRQNGRNKVDFINAGITNDAVFIVKTNTRVSVHFNERIQSKLLTAHQTLNVKNKYLCPEALSAPLQFKPKNNGWTILDGNTPLLDVRADYKIMNTAPLVCSPQAASIVHAALLDTEALLTRYFAEQQWLPAIKLLNGLDKPRTRPFVRAKLEQMEKIGAGAFDSKVQQKITKLRHRVFMAD